MPNLFDRGDLREVLKSRVDSAVRAVDGVPEDEFLATSVDSLVARFTAEAQCDTLILDTSEWVDGDVQETEIDVSGNPIYAGPWGRPSRIRGTRVIADFRWSGNKDLFRYQPSQWIMRVLVGDVRGDVLRVTWEQPGEDVSPDVARQAINSMIEPIAKMVGFANAEVEQHNQNIEGRVREAVERRRERLLKKRELRGALGFKVSRRDDAPRTVPVERKVLGPQRRQTKPHDQRTYQDEWALDEADYEDILTVLTGTLRACERTPSVVTEKDEESLRDQLLIVLNGTYQGAATGETFVAAGKTDILVRVEDRHVFVGECKWWTGAKACGAAVDQLLGYLPWRDEKAALIIFIRQKDATAIIDKADEAVRNHDAFKRVGAPSSDPHSRRNFVLGHPEDPEREIKLAVLFAVI